MYNKKGLYVFPEEKDTYRIFTFDGESVVELPVTTYAQQIIDFTEIDMSVLQKIVVNTRKVDLYQDNYYDFEKANIIIQGNYYYVARRFCESNPVYSFLLSLEMENEIEGTLVGSNYDCDRLIEKSVGIIEDMLILQNEIRSICYDYCMTDGGHEDKVLNVVNEHTEIFDAEFLQVFMPSSFDDLFNEEKYSYPIKRGYYFDTLEEYFCFVLLNFLNYDVNFSACIYCGHFFIPATKRKTRYCDRVRTEDGRTCKQVGPPAIKKVMSKNNTLLDEYNKAVARNYKRVERTENKLSEHHTEKELDIIGYNDWLDKAQQAKKDWIDGKISDDEFSSAIHELD